MKRPDFIFLFMTDCKLPLLFILFKKAGYRGAYHQPGRMKNVINTLIENSHVNVVGVLFFPESLNHPVKEV